MTTKLKYFLLALVIVLTTNCVKNDDQEPEPIVPGEIAYILNEGGFGTDNGTIAKIDITNALVTITYFRIVNQFLLGDIVQSMGETADKYYIVVNNSAKIEVVDKETFASQMTIGDMGSPRYFLAINDTLAYVTDLFAGAIHQINPETGDKYNDISVNGWSEQMERLGDEVYVTLFSDSKVGIIDIDTQSLVDSIPLDLPPNKMVMDKFNKLWVIGSVFEGASKLYKIDGESRMIENEWFFDDSQPLMQLAIDPEGSNIYFGVANSKIFKMDVSATSLPGEPFITHEFQTFYGIGVNKDGKVFACEAFDFVQDGLVLLFDNTGKIESQIPSGVAPNGLVFTE